MHLFTNFVCLFRKPKLCDNPVMEEIIITETTYVRDVHEIISGYMQPLQEHVQSLPVSAHQINSLFGNIEDIRDFHRYGRGGGGGGEEG